LDVSQEIKKHKAAKSIQVIDKGRIATGTDKKEDQKQPDQPYGRILSNHV
jgi:ribosomal protein L34E